MNKWNKWMDDKPTVDSNVFDICLAFDEMVMMFEVYLIVLTFYVCIVITQIHTTHISYVHI